MLAHIPGLRVVMPSSPERAYGLLLAAIRDPDPVVFLEPTRLYRAAKGRVEDDGEALPLDVAFVLKEGRDLTLISWGAMVKETLAAARELAADGIDAEVIDLATLKPYDEETVLASVSKDGALRHCATRQRARGVWRRDCGAHWPSARCCRCSLQWPVSPATIRSSRCRGWSNITCRRSAASPRPHARSVGSVDSSECAHAPVQLARSR